MNLQNLPSSQKYRQSRLLEGSVVNTQQIVTPNTRKKRTVYHTPAIIQTVIEQPDYAPIITSNRRQTILSSRPATLQPIRQSATTVQTSRGRVMQGFPPIVNSYDSRSYGVKVKEDLSNIRPPTIHQQMEAGCCHKLYASTVVCCRLFRCPFWICCLIPLLIILGLIGGSYLYRRNHPLQTSFSNQKLQNQNKDWPKQFDFPETPQNQNTFSIVKAQQKKQQTVQPIVDSRPKNTSSSQYNIQKSIKNEQKGRDIYSKRRPRVIKRVVQIEDKTVQIQKDSQIKEKNIRKVQKTNRNSMMRSKKTSPKKWLKTQRKQESSTQQQSQISTPSLIGSLLSFRLAPTFEEHWTNKHSKRNNSQWNEI